MNKLTKCSVNKWELQFFRDLRQNKGSILKASVDYIRKLRRDQERLKQIEEKQRQTELQNRKMMLRVQVKTVKWLSWTRNMKSALGVKEVPEFDQFYCLSQCCRGSRDVWSFHEKFLKPSLLFSAFIL